MCVCVVCNCVYVLIGERERDYICTKATASRAASASISAHETIPGHKASSCDFASSITSNPLKPMFDGELLSL